MSFAKILVVDDDQGILKSARELQIPGVEILTAANLVDAKECLLKNFLVAAFVDLQLQENTRNADGSAVLRLLAQHRPTAKRILLTAHVVAYKTEFFSLIDPISSLIHGAIDKTEFVTGIQSVIPSLVEARLQQASSMSLQLNDDVFATLKKNYDRMARYVKPALETSLDTYEFVYLLRELFKPARQFYAPSERAVIKTVSLSMLSGGRSSSVVMLTQPEMKGGAKGIFLVIKVGPKGETRTEADNYESYVKYNMALSRRVELLSYVESDVLGGIIYTLAGNAITSIKSLSKFFADEDEAASIFIKKIFSEKSRDWSGVATSIEDIAGYFQQNHRLSPSIVFDSIERFLSNIAITGEVFYRDGKINTQGKRPYRLPKDVVAFGVMRAKVQGVVIHGDLNADNVLTDSESEFSLIDYRYTGIGPAAIDAAALLVSLRLSSCRFSGKNLSEVWDGIFSEAELIRYLSKGVVDAAVSAKWPYWEKQSIVVVESFRESFPEVSFSEIIRTLFLYTLKVVRIEALEKPGRLALIAWLCALGEWIVSNRENL
jgi:CheY-like chemotaxis protein